MELVKTAFMYIFLFIDYIIYSLIGFAYQVFILISKVTLYNDNSDKLNQLTDRIYVILGVAMLFVLAYNIILLIMNPDNFGGKGDKSFQGIFKNLIISVVLLTLMPTIFTYMRNLQDNIIDSQVLERIILGGSQDSYNEAGSSFSDKGRDISLFMFTVFFHPVDENRNPVTVNDCTNGTATSKMCDSYVAGYSKAQKGDFWGFLFDDSLMNGLTSKTTTMEYFYIISTVTGVIALLMFVSYGIDIGIRVAKLAILQIIAPVPVILRITKPSGGIFSKWMNELVQTYLSLFTRLMTIYFAVFTIDLLIESFEANGIFDSNAGGMVKLFAMAFLIVGVLLFAKEAPELLKKFTGGAGGGFGLNDIKKKFTDAGNTAASIPVAGRLGAKAFGAGTGALGAMNGIRNTAADLRRKIAKTTDLEEKERLRAQLDNLSYRDAAKQGARVGWVKGKNQYSNAGHDIWYSHHDYNQKMGLNGESTDSRILNEYKKYESDKYKERALEKYNERLKSDLDGSIPKTQGDVEKLYDSARKSIDKFENSSNIYSEAAKYVDNKIASEHLNVTDSQRAAMISEKLNDVRNTTKDKKIARAIDSYFTQKEIVSKYDDSAYNISNPDISKAIKDAAITENRNSVKAQINSVGDITKNIGQLIKDTNVANKLQNDAQTIVNDLINNHNLFGDIKLNADEIAIARKNATLQVDKAISASGGASNITVSSAVKDKIKVKQLSMADEFIKNAGGEANIILKDGDSNVKNQALIATASRNSEITAVALNAVEEYKKANGNSLSPEDERKLFDSEIAKERNKVYKEEYDKSYKSAVKEQVVEEQKEAAARSVLIDEVSSSENSKIFKEKCKKRERETFAEKLSSLVQEHLEKEQLSSAEERVKDKSKSEVTELMSDYQKDRILGNKTSNTDTGEVDDLYDSTVAGNKDASSIEYKKDDKYKKIWERAAKELEKEVKGNGDKK